MLILGDSLIELKKLEDNSVDCLISDPPYGYSFMGKDWDKVLAPVEIWKEALRVLKAGAFACVMCAPRQDVLSKQISALSDAGFDVGFSSLTWCYASGFPKSLNIKKKMLKDIEKIMKEQGVENVEWEDM